MNGGVCIECGRPFGELHNPRCINARGPLIVDLLVDDHDCVREPEPDAIQLQSRAKKAPLPGMTRIGAEWFNLPAIDRQLKYECQGTHGGSEKTFINLLRRLVHNIQREKGA